MLSRRSMMTTTAALVGGFATASRSWAKPNGKRKFTLDLRTGSIGVRADQREAIRLASRHGFESVNADPSYLGKLDEGELKELVDQLHAANLVWGAAGLPLDFRNDEATFQQGFAELPRLSAAMEKAGISRVGTWLMPTSDELPYVQNFRQHAKRLRECAKVLADHGQRLGLEYVGPKTLWSSKRYPFLHTMAETKDLIAEIGTGNVGFILDSWHWYTAGETVQDLHTLTNQDIVACDLNDAPKGRTLDEQIDNQRELPMATGVIDLKAFLNALVAIGYDGPIRAEPFNAELNAMDNDQSVAATAKAMKRAFALVE